MIYDNTTRTFDCSPTLNDNQILDFCKRGHLILPAVVPDDINQRTCDYLANPSFIPHGMNQTELDRIRRSHEPSTIFLEEWFIEYVLLNESLIGIMRSLLGKNVGLPILASHHKVKCPSEAQQ